MMVLSNDTITANQAPLVHHHNKMLVMALPKDLHKKRFGREKKRLMRRSHSMPLDKKKQTSPKKNRRRSTEDEQAQQAPLSSDRWGSASSSQAQPIIHHHDNKPLPPRSRFTEGQTKKKDSKIKPPTRQRSFEEDPIPDAQQPQQQPPSRRGGQRKCQPRPLRKYGKPQRSKSNIETVVDMIDSVLEQLGDADEEF